MVGFVTLIGIVKPGSFATKDLQNGRKLNIFRLQTEDGEVEVSTTNPTVTEERFGDHYVTVVAIESHNGNFVNYSALMVAEVPDPNGIVERCEAAEAKNAERREARKTAAAAKSEAPAPAPTSGRRSYTGRS